MPKKNRSKIPFGPARCYRDPRTIFPDAVLANVAEMILEPTRDAANHADYINTGGKLEWQDGLSGREHADKWCADLSALSSVSGYLRESLRQRNLRVLELAVNEDMDRLEAMIPESWRGHIRKIIIKPHPDEKRSHWSQATAARFQYFFDSCPNFTELVARAWTPHPRKYHPSLILPMVTHLSIVAPSIVCSTSLHRSFPNLRSLRYIEAMHQLLIRPDYAGCRGPTCGNCALGEGQIAGLFGAKFPHLEDLRLDTYLPSDIDQIHISGLGKPNSWTAIRAVQSLRGKLPALKHLTIAFPGPIIPQREAYDLEAMINWVVALGSPLQRFDLLVQEFITGPLWLRAYGAGLRFDDHLYDELVSGTISLSGPECPHGWEPVENFVALQEDVKNFGRRLLAIKSLASFSVIHGVKLVTGGKKGPGYDQTSILRVRGDRSEVWRNGVRESKWEFDGGDREGHRMVTPAELEDINNYFFGTTMRNILNEAHTIAGVVHAG